MDRFLFRDRRYLICASLLMLGICGCAAPIATLLYVVKGRTTPAECDLLEEKKVAVVCQAPASMQFRTRYVTGELSKLVALGLEKHVRKIEIVDPREVAEWVDENDWIDPIELGKAVNADLVLAIDLEEFQLKDGQTLFRGKANVLLKIHDVKEDEVIWERIPSQVVWPKHVGIPVQEEQEHQFRLDYLNRLAFEIGKYFYAWDQYNDFLG
ncbi:Hypothetical protein PBC10988_14410 [Planctomycetales bacterium 10988]|nr:Hypothetical protein PBC10988_14410 [Planctomycetales bacterium 10988]